MKTILLILLTLFLVNLVAAETIQVQPYETITLPQVESNVSLDTEGLNRTYLICTWRIDGNGEELNLMNANLCPMNEVQYTFENDEHYVVRIDAFKVYWEPDIQNWTYLPPETTGSLDIYYDMQEPPEPSTGFFNNLIEVIRQVIEYWLCQIFPNAGFCR